MRYANSRSESGHGRAQTDRNFFVVLLMPTIEARNVALNLAVVTYGTITVETLVAAGGMEM